MKVLKWLWTKMTTFSPFKLSWPVVVLCCLFELTEQFGFDTWVDAYVRPVVESLDLKLLDYKFRFRRADMSPSDVVLAAIDEKSIGELGRWPWSRDVIAKLVENLNANGAKVVAFDIVFDTEDPSGNYPVMKDLLHRAKSFKGRKALDKKYLTYLSEKTQDANTDQKLVKSVKEANNVLLGYFWYLNESEVPSKKIDFDERLFQISESMFNPTFHREVEGSDAKIDPSWKRAYGLVTNRDPLSAASTHHGYFSTEPDVDGVFRMMPLVVEFEQTFFPALPLKAASMFLDKKIEAHLKVYANGVGDVISMGLEGMPPIPVDYRGFYRLNWRGPDHSFPYYSISDVVKGRKTVTQIMRDPETLKIETKDVPQSSAFKNKIVLVGASAIAVGDIRTTPMGGVYPGPELHMTVIDNILKSQFVTTNNESMLQYVGILFALGTLYILILSRLRALGGSLLLVGVLVGYLGVDYFYFFLHKKLILHIFVPLLMLLTTYLLVTIYKYMTEERERGRVKGAFEKYVSASIVDEMLKDPSKLKLKGEKRRLTVMFSDVRGFTTISEKLDAEKVAEILNRILTPLTEIVFENRGTLDKYMGDALMAFWGAPVRFEDHAIHACRAALKMMAHLKILQEEFEKEGIPPLDMGIGLNTGDMSVGNMGSLKIFDYTVMGDNVNLGSRLEGVTKQYKTHIIISEYTYEEVKDKFLCRFVDQVRVKGKKHPVKIYELIQEKTTAIAPEIVGCVEAYERGMQLYLQRQWDQALRAFEEGMSKVPGDGPSEVFVDRCKYMMEHDPGSDWDGTFVMTSK